MRAVIITTDDSARDQLLAGFGPVALARLPPYTGTRIAHAGIGTLIVIPAGRTATEAAVAAAVATNRLRPDVLLAIGVLEAGAAPIVADAIIDDEKYDVDAQLQDAAGSRLAAAGCSPVIEAVGAQLPAGAGVAAAGRAHDVPTGAVLLPLTHGDTQVDPVAAAALFADEWWASKVLRF